MKANENLRKLILQYYPSVYEFSVALDVSSNTIYDIINGRFVPRTPLFMKMCDLLNIPPWDMYLLYFKED